MNDYPWMVEAKRLIGLKEAPGAENNPEIVKFFKDIKRGGIKEDSEAWCAAFAGHCLEVCGIRSSRYESARSYLDWGEPSIMTYGAIVVFPHHVGFVIGRDEKGFIQVLGGNQADMVKVSSFSTTGAVFRFPKGYKTGLYGELKLMASAPSGDKIS